MAVTSNNDSETAEVTTVAAVTAGTLFVTATTLAVWWPLISAASGVKTTVKCRGILTGVAKSTGFALLNDAPLQIGTALLAAAPSSAGQLINAYCWGDFAATDATISVRLVGPVAS